MGLVLPIHLYDKGEEKFVMTVNGKVNTDKINMVLPHEHIVTDFTGAEILVQPQYRPNEAVLIVLPWLIQLKKRGVSLLAECTPSYIGKDVRLLQQLSKQSGMHIMTNTGYYAAAAQKYLPRHAFTENAGELAARFLKEWKHGIDGTGIRPGFIKLGVDGGPLKEIDKKIIRAAAAAHLKSGLKIAIHTGDAGTAREEFELLAGEGIAPTAFIWIHAQNDKSGDTQVDLAKKGCWISLDGINAGAASIEAYGNQLIRLKKNDLLKRVLISHDDGWAVNKNQHTRSISFDLFKNGNTVPYQAIFDYLKPYLLQKGFSENDFNTLMVKNPREAFAIKICRL